MCRSLGEPKPGGTAAAAAAAAAAATAAAACQSGRCASLNRERKVESLGKK